MKQETILVVLIIAIVIYLGTITIIIDKRLDHVNSLTLQLSGQQLLLNHEITGVYFPIEGGYCVKTEGRSDKDIATTEQHEICHALVDKNHYHFCTYPYNRTIEKK